MTISSDASDPSWLQAPSGDPPNFWLILVKRTQSAWIFVVRRHTALGLVPKRGKRKLGDDDEPQDPEADADEECDLTFTTLARRLVDMAAAAANANNDNNDDATASTSRSVPRQHRPHRTQIPLSQLFNYDLPDNGLDFYWKEGLKNLEGQSEQFEQLHNEQNAVPPSENNVPPVPADASSVI